MGLIQLLILTESNNYILNCWLEKRGWILPTASYAIFPLNTVNLDLALGLKVAFEWNDCHVKFEVSLYHTVSDSNTSN